MSPILFFQRLVLDCIEVVCDLGVVGAELIQHIADIKHVLRCQLDLAAHMITPFICSVDDDSCFYSVYNMGKMSVIIFQGSVFM